MVLYRTTYEAIAALREIDDKYGWELLEAITAFAFDGEIKEVSPIVKPVLPQILYTLGLAKDRYELAKQNGSKGGRPRGIDYAEVAKLNKEGLSNSEIAKKLNCSEDSIRKILKRQVDYAEYQKNQKNLNVNVNDNVNDNANDNVNENVNVNVNVNNQDF